MTEPRLIDSTTTAIGPLRASEASPLLTPIQEKTANVALSKLSILGESIKNFFYQVGYFFSSLKGFKIFDAIKLDKNLEARIPSSKEGVQRCPLNSPSLSDINRTANVLSETPEQYEETANKIIKAMDKAIKKKGMVVMPLETRHAGFFGKENHYVMLLIDPTKKEIFFIDGKGNDPKNLQLFNSSALQEENPGTVGQFIDEFKKLKFANLPEGEWTLAYIKDKALQGIMDCAPFSEVAGQKIQDAKVKNPDKSAQDIMDGFVSDWEENRTARQGEVNDMRDRLMSESIPEPPKTIERSSSKVDADVDVFSGARQFRGIDEDGASLTGSEDGEVEHFPQDEPIPNEDNSGPFTIYDQEDYMR